MNRNAHEQSAVISSPHIQKVHKQVAMIGEGAWGTAIASLLADNGWTVNLWCQDPAVAQDIQDNSRNSRYLPGVTLSSSIIPTTSFAQTLSEVTYVFFSTPVPFVRSVLTTLKPFLHPQQCWIFLNKGIEKDTLLFPYQILDEIAPCALKKVIVAGPSFASEVAHKQLTAVTVAAQDCSLAAEIQLILANSYFRPYTTTDMVGVAVGSAMKNVIAIGLGIAEGAQLGENTKAFLFTRGLHELVTVTKELGGKESTMYGLAGVGDLFMTSISKESRNYSLGLLIGQQKTLAQIVSTSSLLPEGVHTIQSLYQLMSKRNLDLPVCKGIYQILFEERSIVDLVDYLMQRPLESEC